MEFKNILMFILLFSIQTFGIENFRTTKESMLASLDINGTSKETIATIINSSFNLRAYKENYFTPASYRYGGDIPSFEGHDTKNIETEFQLSIRYDFASNILGLGELYSFGYTQRSWWQLYSESAFFRESNYQPEFFVKIPTYSFLSKQAIKGFKLGLIHQSNGRGGEYERSWNRVTLSTFLQTKNLITELELWHRLPDNIDYNPDLIDYLGYGQLKFMLPYKEHLFKLTFRSNSSSHKSSSEFIYTYPLPIKKQRDLFLYLKAFNGYGESLIDYNHNVNKFSIGVSISR